MGRLLVAGWGRVVTPKEHLISIQLRSDLDFLKRLQSVPGPHRIGRVETLLIHALRERRETLEGPALTVADLKRI